MNATDLNTYIRSRVSTFIPQFIPGEKIDDDIVVEILRNALAAPDHSKKGPWHFTVFTGEGLTRLSQFQSNLYKQVRGEQSNEVVFQKLLQQPLKASHIIAIGMKRSTSAIPEIEDIEAVACAVQNIYLSLAAYNIGGYWGSGGITYYEEAKSFFGLGENDKLLGFFYLGHIATASIQHEIPNYEEKVTWVRE